MADQKFNDWDYLPINLSPEQIADPLSVIDDFFSLDWLPGHIEHLHRWQLFILKDAFYVDVNGHPFHLLASFRHNIKLIEACHLILHHIDTYKQSIALNADQMESERKAWKHYPDSLKLNELLNPLSVMEDFFTACSLPEYREQLNEWLDAGLSHRAGGEFMNTSDIISLKENLIKLYGAALLIYQRMTDDPYLKKDEDKIDEAVVNSIDVITSPSVYKLDNVIVASQHEQISQIVNIMKDRVPSIQAIIYLGISPIEKPTMFFLVLTDNKEKGLAQDISNHLEESSKKVANAVVLVHHAASLFTARDDKNLFLKKAANCPVIYLSGGLILPKDKETDHEWITGVALRKWQRWHSQSLEFLKGAEYYLTIGAHNAALLSLSLTAECSLVAIIRLVTGYEINIHNLDRLLKLTQMFTGDIAAVFKLDNDEHKKLFNILKNAYVEVRYRDNYEIDAASVSALYPLIKKMLAVLDQLSNRHILSSTL